MPTDHTGDPWTGTTYHGFAGGPAAKSAAPPPQAAPRRRPSTRTLMLGGVAGALALGLVFGLVARPELATRGTPQTPATAPAATTTSRTTTSQTTASQIGELAPPGAAQVPIAVSPPVVTPSPTPKPIGRMEVLPPGMTAAARAPVRPSPWPRTPSPNVSTATTTIDPEVAPEPPRIVAAAPLPPPAIIRPAPVFSAAPPESRARASFDCRTARAGAEQIVCSDPMLGAADRQMARAYRRAQRSGVNPTDLRQEQRDWVAIREDAARRSPRALASVYDQRIQELNEIADQSPNPPPDGE